MLLYVLRHGVTQWNKLKKVQGAVDIPLAPEGIELAKKTGEALKDIHFDICFTSPLTRAKQTAQYVLGDKKVPIIEDKRIQEIDFGVLEGTQFKDAQGKIISHEMEIFFTDPLKFKRPENGENISDILKQEIGHKSTSYNFNRTDFSRNGKNLFGIEFNHFATFIFTDDREEVKKFTNILFSGITVTFSA